MKGFAIAFVALAFVQLLSVPSAASVKGKALVIYGSDDRIDLYQTENQTLLSLADSTVALMRDSSVMTADNVSMIMTRPYGAGGNLCKEEPFYDQVSAAFCSGSLVAPDIIMTAGHCVPSKADCAGVRFVFGFAVRAKGKMPLTVPAKDVYGCAQLLDREQIEDGADWALVKLDRPVTGHKVLKLNLTGEIENKTPLLVIGHPAGLPTKIAGGGAVRDASKNGYFVANLDTFGGNSGSAVFNAQSLLVEGILVRGESDYKPAGSCRVSNVCLMDGCRGEDVTKISAVSDKLLSAQHQVLAAALEPTFESLLISMGQTAKAKP